MEYRTGDVVELRLPVVDPGYGLGPGKGLGRLVRRAGRKVTVQVLYCAGARGAPAEQVSTGEDAHLARHFQEVYLSDVRWNVEIESCA